MLLISYMWSVELAIEAFPKNVRAKMLADARLTYYDQRLSVVSDELALFVVGHAGRGLFSSVRLR